MAGAAEGGQGGDLRHILRGEGKGEEVPVLRHPGGGHRLGQGEDPLFQAPPQADLGRRLAVVLGDGGEDGVVQHPAPAQGAPGLHQDTVVPAEGQGLPLLAAGVELDLVHHGGHLSLQQGLQVVGAEVGHADGPDLPRLVELCHGPPGVPVDGLPVVELVGGGGPVDEVEVQVVGAQAVQGGLEGGLGWGIAPVGVPNLAGEEDRLPGQAAGPEGLAHAGLVAVVGGGVNVAVAQGEGGLDGGHGLRPVLHPPGAVAQAGDGHAVGQGEGVAEMGLLCHRVTSLLWYGMGLVYPLLPGLAMGPWKRTKNAARLGGIFETQQ